MAGGGLSDDPTLMILLGFPVVFLAIWFLVTRLLMKIAGLSRAVDLSSLGPLVESYGTGSAVINGVSFRNCMVVERYQRGYLLRQWRIFGGGMRALPLVDIESIVREPYFFFDSVVIRLRQGRPIRLYGRLVEKFS